MNLDEFIFILLLLLLLLLLFGPSIPGPTGPIKSNLENAHPRIIFSLFIYYYYP